MGEPDARTHTNHKDLGKTVKVWRYLDQWWGKDQWGSWDVYFDEHQRFVGWSLVEPAEEARPRVLGDEREAVYVLPPPPL